MSTTIPNAKGAVTAVLEEFVGAWENRNLQKVADRWDEQGSGLSFVADELGEVLTDRERITDHLLRTEHRVTSSKVRMHELHVHELAEGLMLATFVCQWDFEWTSFSRITMILRYRHPDWKFVHYMEAPFHMEDTPSE